ncbi:epidermal growth factor receptor substrate 15-like 1 isoform X2 [Anneissia japonica]|uniref:epidermal growth factor receptor substrate 15-like 1 isoform X2 n=1 Tax=Anneissia japonica TaxID=1529436 RepID=UPI001425B353|nr:epidermal growth factor receptor substrate 15-like 1 isoform X2 [Anneissia japonica]
MAAFPSVTQVAGSNISGYEALYRQFDKFGSGHIGATDAAVFLKRSGLKESTLHKIWELSDPGGRGYLDKQAIFVALKLIALAQNGKDVSMASITTPVPLPSMANYPAQAPRTSTPPASSSPEPWAIKPDEKVNYDHTFQSLGPIDGKLSGDMVKPVLMNSKLPLETLSKIWDLSDIDKDGLLDKEEFAVAMHLVRRAMENEQPPAALTPNLVPPSRRKKPLMAGAVPVFPAPINIMLKKTNLSPQLSPTSSPSLPVKQTNPLITHTPSSWVVTAQDKTNSDAVFKRIDSDVDGYVTGEEVRDTLIQSGLPQTVLAQIWNLCDIKQTGKLNSEQFALAMYLVQESKQGKPVPEHLTSEMMPPSSRPKPGSESAMLTDLGLSGAVGVDFNAIKELDDIQKEIDDCNKEKLSLKAEIKEQEEQVKMKTLEIQSLQSELDRTSTQVKQLEDQKGEAQKKLDELDQQKDKLEGLLKEVKQQYDEAKKNLEDLKLEIATQEKSVKNQEEEVNRARIDLSNLRQEENQLEQQIEQGKGQVDMLNQTLKTTNQDIQQVQTKINILKESQNKLNNSITQINNAIDSGTTAEILAVHELDKMALSQDLDVMSVRPQPGGSPGSSITSGFSMNSEVTGKMEDFGEDDPFKNKDLFSGRYGGSVTPDPFKTTDPFKEDPFKGDSFPADPFAGDPFGSSSDPFGSQSSTVQSDPFQSDPFSSTSSSLVNGQSESKSSSNVFGALDAFGGSTFSADFSNQNSKSESFSSDPFKTSEERPALPPKKQHSKSKAQAFQAFTSDSNDPFTSSSISKDPFASVGSDPFSSLISSTSSSGNSKDPFSSGNSSQDPFSLGTSSSQDPFSSSSNDPFISSTGSLPKSGDPFGPSGAPVDKSGGDPFAGFADFGKFDTNMTEEEQLEWAKKESEQLEKDRQSSALKEEEELKIALALSKTEVGSSEV